MIEDRMPDEWFERTTARTIQRVVPIVQKEKVAGIMVALSYLEVHEAGYGVLWTLVSRRFQWSSLGKRRGLTEPEVHIHHSAGLSCDTRFLEAGGSYRNTNGATILSGLPESGELRVEVARIFVRNLSGDNEEESRSGPWTFRFSI